MEIHCEHAIFGFKPGGFTNFQNMIGKSWTGAFRVYALPAAIGASLAGPDPVVALIGDGGLQFTLSELASAHDANANITLILHDNSGYGEIRKHMASKSIPLAGVDIFTPDLRQIALACGWQVQTVAKDDLDRCLEEGSRYSGPKMIYLAHRVD